MQCLNDAAPKCKIEYVAVLECHPDLAKCPPGQRWKVADRYWRAGVSFDHAIKAIAKGYLRPSNAALEGVIPSANYGWDDESPCVIPPSLSPEDEKTARDFIIMKLQLLKTRGLMRRARIH
jgi:hypothetical protein